MRSTFRLASYVFVMAPFFAQAQDAIDGYVSPAIGYSSEVLDSKTVSTTRMEVQFGRLQKNVELDLSFSLASPKQYSAILKFFKHFKMAEGGTSTGVSVGIGGGSIFATSSSVPRKYADLVFYPYVRGLYDFGIGMGLALEAGMNLKPVRYYRDGGTPDKLSTFRNGFSGALTLMITSRWLE